jgi:hypothetical protein
MRCMVSPLRPFALIGVVTYTLFAVERPVFVKRHSRGQGSPDQIPIHFFFCLGAQLIVLEVRHSILCVRENCVRTVHSIPDRVRVRESSLRCILVSSNCDKYKRPTHHSHSLLIHTHSSCLLTMSEHIIAPRNYRIESNVFPKQVLSVGRDDAIVGNRPLLGGIQTVGLDHILYILATDHKHVVGAQVRRSLCDVPRRKGNQGG